MELCGWQRAKYINNVCKAFVASTMPFQYVATTDVYRPEKKDQVLKPYVYCMAKLSIATTILHILL